MSAKRSPEVQSQEVIQSEGSSPYPCDDRELERQRIIAEIVIEAQKASPEALKATLGCLIGMNSLDRG